MKITVSPMAVRIMMTGICFIFMTIIAVAVHGASLQEEFNSLCIHTQEAEDLSMERLQEFITQCDQLQKKIEESNDQKKKVLLFRLDKCRNFYAYLIELKQHKE